MSLRGWLGWPVVAALGALVVVPVLALGPAAVIDFGPKGTARSSAFYVALAASDPFVWACLRASLTMAVVVAVGSWTLGTALALAVGRWRFWGRGPLSALAWTPLAIPPMGAAIGLDGLARRLGAATIVGDDWRAWLIWLWAELIGGVALVALATLPAVGRIEPSWEDAARLAGASRRRTWMTVAWPLIRPASARAVAAVFALTILEPGAPMVLGLRRTLAAQVVESAGAPSTAPRAAALALAALAMAGMVRLMARWWGRAPWPTPIAVEPPVARRARGPRATGLVLRLGAWVVLALAPVAGLIWEALATDPGRPWSLSGSAFRALVDDPEVLGWAARSLGVGLAACALGLALSIAAVDRRPGRAATLRRILCGLPAAMPPMAIALGILMIPRLLAGPAPVGAAEGHPTGIRKLAGAIDPDRSPGVALALALAVIHLPMLARASTIAQGRSSPRLIEAARTLGASRGRARWTALGLWLGSTPASALVLTLALSINAVGPALVLARAPDRNTIGPAIVDLAGAPGGGRPRAAALAIAACALNLSAFALASRRRPAPIGDWYRG